MFHNIGKLHHGQVLSNNWIYQTPLISNPRENVFEVSWKPSDRFVDIIKEDGNYYFLFWTVQKELKSIAWIWENGSLNPRIYHTFLTPLSPTTQLFLLDSSTRNHSQLLVIFEPGLGFSALISEQSTEGQRQWKTKLLETLNNYDDIKPHVANSHGDASPLFLSQQKSENRFRQKISVSDGDEEEYIISLYDFDKKNPPGKIHTQFLISRKGKCSIREFNRSNMPCLQMINGDDKDRQTHPDDGMGDDTQEKKAPICVVQNVFLPEIDTATPTRLSDVLQAADQEEHFLERYMRQTVYFLLFTMHANAIVAARHQHPPFANLPAYCAVWKDLIQGPGTYSNELDVEAFLSGRNSVQKLI